MGESRRRKQAGDPPKKPKRNPLYVAERREIANEATREVLGQTSIIPHIMTMQNFGRMFEAPYNPRNKGLDSMERR